MLLFVGLQPALLLGNMQSQLIMCSEACDVRRMRMTKAARLFLCIALSQSCTENRLSAVWQQYVDTLLLLGALAVVAPHAIAQQPQVSSTKLQELTFTLHC